jgi:hypothetical protein
MAVEQTRQSPFTAFRLKLGVSKADLMKAWEGGEGPVGDLIGDLEAEAVADETAEVEEARV